MSARVEMVRACATAIDGYAPAFFSKELTAASTIITRDGLILEKLHALIASLSTGSDRSKEIAEELKAIVGDAR